VNSNQNKPETKQQTPKTGIQITPTPKREKEVNKKTTNKNHQTHY
jgi:hypothetical protein